MLKMKQLQKYRRLEINKKILILCKLSVITGIIGLTKFDEEKEKNKWMAIAGIIFGVIGAVAAIILIPYVLKEFNI